MYVYILFTNYCTECLSIITLSLRLKIVIFLTFSLIQSIAVVIVALVSYHCSPNTNTVTPRPVLCLSTVVL